MDTTEATASLQGAQDALPAADEMLALTSSVATKDGVDRAASLTEVYQHARSRGAGQRADLEARMLRQAPAYIELHNDLQASQTLLDELGSFLNVFYTDLNLLSSQMSQLQRKSIVLGQQLRNRRQLEHKLRRIVEDIVLEPRYVDLIFADEATAGRAGLEAWKGCAERLSACLIACSELESVLRSELKQAGSATASGDRLQIDGKALREARELAEGCRVMAVSKIRPLLITTFSPLRSSLSTNMPVLQAVLLKSYRPLFMFLSHHAPRVAIDVQRAYVAAARLYFETGFRRYERNLGKVRDRVKSSSTLSSATGSSSTSAASVTTLSFTEFPAKAGALSGGIGVPFIGSSAPSSSSSADPWMIDVEALENAKIAEGPAVVLAYLADDATFRAPIEALFRSLSLTFLDNATAEYCFLARFFEGIDLDVDSGAAGTSRIGSQTTGSSSVVKVQHADVKDAPSHSKSVDDDGPLPEESASAKGDHDDEGGEEEETKSIGTVVRLSEPERRRIRGRGAIDKLWNQVMEPVVGTYNHFTGTILALHPPLVPLYTMLKLNDRILAEVEERGAASVLQGTFMAFKLRAWPMMQKQFDDAIEAVKRLRTGGASSTAAGISSAASGLLGGLGGLFGSSASASEATTGSGNDKPTVTNLVCERYARLYSSVAYLHSSDKDEQESATIFATLGRLRAEIELLLKETGKQQQQQPSQGSRPDEVARCYRLIRETLERGPASLTLPKIQSEMSHWTEAEHSRQRGV